MTWFKSSTTHYEDNLNGLVAGLLGSSSMDASRSVDNFMVQISDRTGLILENYAVGGSSTTSKTENWETDVATFPSGLQKAHQLITDNPELDLILCQPLINDEYLTLGDFESVSPTTCYGAMHMIVKWILETYPRKPFGLITGQYVPGLNKNKVSLRHECIKEIGHYYGVPVLDLRGEGLTPYVLDSFKSAYVPDGTHLNYEGNTIAARRVEAFIRMLMTGYVKPE